MVTKKNRSDAERIADFEAKIAAIKERAKKKTPLVLNLETPGMKELIEQFEKIVDDNKTTSIELVKTISRLKRTGLTMERKSKTTTE